MKASFSSTEIAGGRSERSRRSFRTTKGVGALALTLLLTGCGARTYEGGGIATPTG